MVGSNPAHPVMPSLALGVRNLSGLNFSGSSQKSGDRCKLYTCNNIQIELTQIRNQFSILKVVRALAYQVDSQSSCKNTRKVLTSSTYRYKEVYSLWYWIPSWITFVPSWRKSAPHCHVRRTIIHMKKKPPTIQVITKRSFNTCGLTIYCNAVTKPKPKKFTLITTYLEVCQALESAGWVKAAVDISAMIPPHTISKTWVSIRQILFSL